VFLFDQNNVRTKISSSIKYVNDVLEKKDLKKKIIGNSGFRQSGENRSIQRSLLSSSLYSDREHTFTIVIIRDVRLRLSLSFDERNDRFVSSLMND
jgi:hypothetical protein